MPNWNSYSVQRKSASLPVRDFYCSMFIWSVAFVHDDDHSLQYSIRHVSWYAGTTVFCTFDLDRTLLPRCCTVHTVNSNYPIILDQGFTRPVSSPVAIARDATPSILVRLAIVWDREIVLHSSVTRSHKMRRGVTLTSWGIVTMMCLRVHIGAGIIIFSKFLSLPLFPHVFGSWQACGSDVTVSQLLSHDGDRRSIFVQYRDWRRRSNLTTHIRMSCEYTYFYFLSSLYMFPSRWIGNDWLQKANWLKLKAQGTA
jgi:hypothetical protein